MNIEDHRQIIKGALKAGAYDCGGNCGLSERECADRHDVTWAGTARAGGPDEVVFIAGTTEGVANIILAAYGAAGLTLTRKDQGE